MTETIAVLRKGQLPLLPTLLDIAAVPNEQRMDVDGQSLLPLAQGASFGDDRAVIAEYHAEGVMKPRFMVRSGAYKYIYLQDAPAQLFDLDQDPGERANLSGFPEHQDVVTRLREVVESSFDTQAIEPDVWHKLQKKRIIRQAMHRNDTHWDYQPMVDASKQYIRASAGKSYVRT